MLKNITDGVEVWEHDITIPTYLTGNPDKNPMFLEKRVYQGSSGKVYPHSVIDKICDEKVDKTYRAVFLENKYLFVMVLPELGGRIQRALDKTNGYDFVYYNHVIKPALVGLCGPWISGGIEFNWPQHHRPSTFDPVSYQLQRNADGSAGVVVGEIENMFRTKGMATFTLHPDKAYIQVDAQLYNRTGFPQTFLWWANPAVPVNNDTQSVFPPDVHAVMDHGKRAVSNFPVATGTYYKQDYSAGVDISRYKNIPVPTSYMAYHSDYDFVGGYDYQREAGILHVADHHISPGKKQWTWGCGDFGQAWDRNLTDSDGPYVELMTGCFTDNQPDFAWLAPYEEKTFTQYFMPYKKVGMVKNATVNAAVGLSITKNSLNACVYATSPFFMARVVITADGKTLEDSLHDLSPEQPYECSFQNVKAKPEACRIAVYRADGRLLVDYIPQKEKIEPAPSPAKAAPAPREAATTEDLFLYGLHLEQYRHATFEPAEYYLEGLRRDPTDVRLNNAYGGLLMRRGCFAQAEVYLRAAVEKLTRSNPNPADGTPFYQLGLCLLYQGRPDEAYDHFFKATWNDMCQTESFYQLACIDSLRGDFIPALEHINRSLVRNTRHMKARTLKTALLRRLGRKDEALLVVRESLEIDPMDLAAHYECGNTDELFRLLGGNANTAVELALEYSAAGLREEAMKLLQRFEELSKTRFPMVRYHMGCLYSKGGEQQQAVHCFRLAEAEDSFGCFPHRLEDIQVLEEARRLNPGGAKAPYYMGCLWYDKKQYESAVECWESAAALDPSFPTAHRNLALAYYNKKNDAKRARMEMETAFHLDKTDARVLLELDQLYKKLGVTPEKRLDFLEKNRETVFLRDDLSLEYIALKNMTGEYEKAMQLLQFRKFHPWEGGEGKVPAQYVLCRVMLARQALRHHNFQKAVDLLTQATTFPHNLGEGKLENAQENDVHYYLGCAYEGLEEKEKAARCFEKASQGIIEPAGMMYYNDQPPEGIYFQGLALKKLNKEEEARGRFHKLISYGETHLFDHVSIDYFAVSLPDLFIFDENLDQKNRVHCLFLMGLGSLGLGDQASAGAYLAEALSQDPNHAGVLLHLSALRELQD